MWDMMNCVKYEEFAFVLSWCVMMSEIMINEFNACYLSNVQKHVPSLSDSKLSSQVPFSFCRQQHTGFLLFSLLHPFPKLSPLTSLCNLTCLCRLLLRTGLEPSKLRPVAFAVQSKNRLVFSTVLGTHLDIISVGKAKGKNRSQTKAISIDITKLSVKTDLTHHLSVQHQKFPEAV